ncbi:Gfo/Idh/MocA family protein [Deinococcus multiflagellatus]|uniref:Gfo/Idh/MocA family protein n=1 Tax=Deinococcus multiflagellatus TaxID=1656887 RepID=A0ABW1ZII7_9DEIO|nr:Gfo/Idh/MocA family oxidoreductase [Deinococcus multiflagellatus]MBZ9712617.1 Gfo/Idh/MocA family oxidoreductase [Deinococcus multiflagellatus]
MTTPFRWGILGAARIARALIPAIRDAGGEVTALGVRDPHSERARAFAQEWEVPLVGDYAAVLASDVDAVYNPLPGDLHHPWTLAALQAGKHALTEKPMTLNAAQAQDLADAAAHSGRVLLEAFAYRFQPHVARLRQIVAEDLGEIRAVRAAFGFHMDNPHDFRWHAAQGGGALYDVGTYPVNLTRLLLGEPLSAQAAARWTEGGPAAGVDVALSGVLTYPSALVSLDCAFDWTDPSTQAVTVVGTRGTLHMEGVFHSHTQGPQTLRLTVGEQVREEVFGASNGYAHMVRHFMALAAGQTPALYPPADAVAQARVLDALYASARSGRVQPLA